MGTWGTGLYSNDTAADLRDGFKEVVRAPWDGDRLVAWALEHFPGGAQPADEDYPEVWLVLADLFWLYGIEHARTHETALGIVAAGSDLALKRALGMSERDLARRGQGLAALAAKWQTPNAKPRPRRMLRGPERFVLDVGNCLTYPLTRGQPRNPYVGPSLAESYYALYGWAPDGWGAAIVLLRYHRTEVFARYLVAVLRHDAPTKPALEAFRVASILHNAAAGGTTTRRVHAVSTTAQHLKRMEVEVLGRLAVDARAVAAEFGMDKPPISHGESELSNFAGLTVGPRGPAPVDDPIARYLVGAEEC